MDKMKKIYCECGKGIDKRSKKCASCSHKGELAGNYKDGRSLKKYFCECGVEISDYRHKYCKRCALTTHHPMKGMFGELNPNFKGWKSINHCSDCKKEIVYYAERCWDCYVKWSQIPENNPNYIHGKCYEPYPLGWTNTFKEQIRFRDNYKCPCGCHEVENCRKLDVHHIDYDKKNLNPNNLISLCQRCHGKTNGKDRDYWIKYYQDKMISKEIEIKR